MGYFYLVTDIMNILNLIAGCLRLVAFCKNRPLLPDFLLFIICYLMILVFNLMCVTFANVIFNNIFDCFGPKFLLPFVFRVRFVYLVADILGCFCLSSCFIYSSVFVCFCPINPRCLNYHRFKK